MKKVLIIGAVVSIILPLLAFAGLFFYASSVSQNDTTPLPPPPPPPVDIKTTTLHGKDIQTKCLPKYENFIKDYGADYSKCSEEFIFAEPFCGGFDPATQGLSDVNILVVLDASGSMAEQIDGQKKINIAKKAVTDFLAQMPEGVKTGLVVYGHRGTNSQSDKQASCQGIEEVVKLGQNNKTNILNALNSIDSKGWTPIAGSIDFVNNIFKDSGANNKNYLVLLSDGIESCDGDPLVSAENLKIETRAKLSIIGFADNKEIQDYLKKVASWGGGSYVSAQNTQQITKAFNDQLLIIKKDCLTITSARLTVRFNENYQKNLNCWLQAQTKEADAFKANILDKSKDVECNKEMADVLKARQTEFWLKKLDVDEESRAYFNKTSADYQSQIKAIEDLSKTR